VSPASGSFVVSPYLTAGGVFSPTFCAIGNNVVQYVIGTSTCNNVDTKLIKVEAFVPATIVGSIPDQCNTSIQPVSLLGLTANNLGSWSGPGVVGDQFYPSSAGVGLITLYYGTASSPSSLCATQQALSVTIYSIAPPSIGQAGPFCNSMPAIKLTATPLGGVFGNNTSAVSLSGWFNPAFGVIGDNLINYSVSAGPCLAYVQSIIRVEKFISADFLSYKNRFCKNDLAVDLNNFVQNLGGTWSGPGLTGSIFTPSNALLGNTNIVRYTTQSQTTDLCADTSDMFILVNDIPDVSIVRDRDKGCAPVEVIFNTPNVNKGSARWTFGDGSETSEGLTASHTYTAAGVYSVVLSYWDEIRCTSQATLSNAVTVFDIPNAGFTYGPYQEITIADPSVQFINQSQNIGNCTYQWQIADLYSLNDVNPLVVFPSAGEYRINLIATTTDGCKSEISDIISIKPDFNVFIPNSFSPNFDGLNDVFLPVFSNYGIDNKTFDMEILDRWGSLLYKTTDPTRGWNGSVQNSGEQLKNDVYVYRIKYKDLEGRIYSKIGYLSLMK
jgi:gliding motility-associated-like protein